MNNSNCQIVKVKRNSGIFYGYEDENLYNFFYWWEFARFDKLEGQNIYKLTPISYIEPKNEPPMDFFNPYKIIYITGSQLQRHFESAENKSNHNHPLTNIFT